MAADIVDGNNPGADRLRHLGELTYLFFRSDTHRRMPLGAMRRLIQPPVDLDQVLIIRENERPLCAFTWAFLSEDAERRFRAGEMLEPTDWRSGKNMWVMDMVSACDPKIGARAIKWFLENIPGHVTQLHWIRFDAAGVNMFSTTLKRYEGRWRRTSRVKL